MAASWITQPPGSMPFFDPYSLTLNGQPTYAGCGPVALGMITGAYHNQVPAWQALSPQGLIDANAGLFTERGIGIHQFDDDLRAARYTPRTYMGTNWETLQTVVNRGPAVAYVEWEWKPGGAAHGVVVTDANDKEVHIADPGTGTEYVVPTPQFQQSWKSQGNVLYGVEPFWKLAKDKESKKAPPPWRTGRKPGR